MKKLVLTVLLLAINVPTWARDGDNIFLERRHMRYQNLPENTPPEFSESQMELPPIPDANQGDWFDLYIENNFVGQPRILLSSITTAPDDSIRYVLNQRSANGYDNITAEGLYCVRETKLLNSEGSKYKIFAFADMTNHRWIQARTSTWNMLGNKQSATDRVRRVLYDAFCSYIKAQNDDEVRLRVRKQGRRAERDNGK